MKGAIMRTQTQTQPCGLEAERIWGVEAMDPVELFDWAKTLWRRLYSPAASPLPLLLVYTPSAERTAIRSLLALARLGRRHAVEVFFSTPESLPWLEVDPVQCRGLHLLHHGSRFLNLAAWIKIATDLAACPVVVTMPAHEYECLPEPGLFDVLHVPEEDRDYCACQANEIIATYFHAAALKLEPLEEILVEAGVAEVAVPFNLLARYLRRDRLAIFESLQSQRLRAFIWGPEDPAAGNGAVAFRGRWLAEKLAPKMKPGSYSHLAALLTGMNSNIAEERYFFLRFLAALRAQGFFHHAAHLQEFYHHHFYFSREAAPKPERHAWDWVVHNGGLLPFLRILFYFVEARFKALYYQLFSLSLKKIHRPF
jgi:hypothetical protein